jgi:hypothetical protein
MRRKLIWVSIALGIVFAGKASLAEEDTSSANYFLPGCQLFAGENVQVSDFKAGACAGIVETLLFMNTLVLMNTLACPPRTSTLGQATRVVVAYIKQRPTRMHENFIMLAREALIDAWPCK